MNEDNSFLDNVIIWSSIIAATATIVGGIANLMKLHEKSKNESNT